MLDCMSDSIQGSRIENLQSREVDRQSPTGLIFTAALHHLVLQQSGIWWHSVTTGLPGNWHLTVCFVASAMSWLPPHSVYWCWNHRLWFSYICRWNTYYCHWYQTVPCSGNCFRYGLHVCLFVTADYVKAVEIKNLDDWMLCKEVKWLIMYVVLWHRFA